MLNRITFDNDTATLDALIGYSIKVLVLAYFNISGLHCNALLTQ